MSVTKYEYGWWSDEDFFYDIKRKTKRADERAWKHQVQEEIDDMENDVTSVYVVVNEWLRVGSDESASEIVAMFSTYDKAHWKLGELGDQNDVYVTLGDDNFVIESTRGLVYDEYRIDEWELDTNG
ncbi:MAG TPA: hypothetical protein VIY48_19235 [Candidatus Paceibacterota bacterium]